VLFAGSETTVEARASYLASADVMAFTARIVSHPMALIEGMAAGCAVVAYDIEGGVSIELSAGTLRSNDGAAFPAQVLVRSAPTNLFWDGSAWRDDVARREPATMVAPSSSYESSAASSVAR
jgi:glycosyltransferase involved in cell wall biosynthesis